MPNIYIANRGFHDYTRTQRYLQGGKTVAITTGNVDIKSTDRLEERIQFALRDAAPEDLLLLGGAPIVGALAQAYLTKRFGGVNILFFDPARREYIARHNITGAERRIEAGDGTIVCCNCGRVVAEAPPGVRAVATEPCELCMAEQEEETMLREEEPWKGNRRPA